MDYKENNEKVYQKGQGNRKIYFDQVNGICLKKVDIFSAEDADLGIKRFEYLNCVNKFGKLLGFSMNPPSTF